MNPIEKIAPAAPYGITPALLEKYDRPGPRYTSYPTAPEWKEDFKFSDYEEKLAEAGRKTEEPLSLYMHIPFCEARCWFCGCNVTITHKEDAAETYLDFVEIETARTAELLGPRKKVVQLHWGGGTPTYLAPDQLARLFSVLTSHFEILPEAEVGIEVDPRVTTFEQMKLLKQLGFNRLSMGVQDFDPQVQEAVHRVQPFQQTKALFDFAREIGFASINIDLIYGLPYQSPESFRQTVKQACAFRPDRLAVYAYAHVPWLKAHQKLIPEAALPKKADKLALFITAAEELCAAGYLQIGMDHFALPQDELAKALFDRQLHRNFMGYTTMPEADLIGLGVSAIGDLCGAYAQNEVKINAYYSAVAKNRLAAHRGYRLDADDLARRWLIRSIMCLFSVSFSALKENFGIDYAGYFAPEDGQLDHFIDDGFLVRRPDGLEVTPLGRFFVRNIAMTFDRYLRQPKEKPVFSRTI
ncbi:MAG: oxygen-independent coproporphyrinogen III oxidase [Candidatus Zixiibacteriota bacterium]